MTYKTMIDGNQIPVMGLGTWQLADKNCADTVSFAYQLGYRHFDLAETGANHKAVAAGLAPYPRYNYFLTSKISHSKLRQNDTLRRVEMLLKILGTDYLDLLLLHWPNGKGHISETFDALSELLDQDKVRSIGVCNYDTKDLEDARRIADFHIVNNQVEYHPHLFERRLFSYCDLHEIDITVYSPAFRYELLENAIVEEIAASRSATSYQVFLSWLLKKGVLVIPQSTCKEQLLNNLAALNLELSSDECNEIDSVYKSNTCSQISWDSGLPEGQALSGLS